MGLHFSFEAQISHASLVGMVRVLDVHGKPLSGGTAQCQVGLPKHGYESIPINTIFRGMNIHLPAILMFTRGTRF